MKTTFSGVIIVGILVAVLIQFSPLMGHGCINKCKCSMETGFDVAERVNGVVVFAKAYWFYVRLIDGTSGPPVRQASLNTWYSGSEQPAVECIDSTTSYGNGLVNQYEVEPSVYCYVSPSILRVGENRTYPAHGAAPQQGDGNWRSGPTQWGGARCTK